MKAILPLALSLAALGAIAQTDKAPLPSVPVPPPAPAPPNDFAAPPPAPLSTASATPARPAKPLKRVAPAAFPNAPVMAQPVQPPPAPEKAAPTAAKKDRVFLENDLRLPRSTKTGRTLVVKTSNPDPETITDAEEDLSVMALILRKATAEDRADDKRIALGIEVDSTLFGSSSGARNIYVEGYGALFLLGVRFPLVAPTDKVEEAEVKEPGSDWAEAREEFLRGERNTFELQLERVWSGVSQLRADRLASEDYDADKVDDLKTELLEALKNATHIRALKPEESVTVVIQGAEAMRVEKTVSRSPGGGGVKVTGSRRGDSRRGETVMTVSVKKSDVDAFAKGSLDLAGFRKKASIQTYFRRGDASVATSPYLTPVR